MAQVGQEIEMQCGRCKEPRDHIVAALGEGGKIEVVVCNFCHTSRKYREPKQSRGEKEATPRRRRTATPKLDFDGPSRPYSPRESFDKGSLIEHPKFGKGRVQEVRGDRIDVRFANGTVKVLMHGR